MIKQAYEIEKVNSNFFTQCETTKAGVGNLKP